MVSLNVKMLYVDLCNYVVFHFGRKAGLLWVVPVLSESGLARNNAALHCELDQLGMVMEG